MSNNKITYIEEGEVCKSINVSCVEINTGPQGIQGEQGNIGLSGPKGETGTRGKTGLPGPAGAPSIVEGPIGQPGAKGDDGDHGDDIHILGIDTLVNIFQKSRPASGDVWISSTAGRDSRNRPVDPGDGVVFQYTPHQEWLSIGPLQGPKGPLEISTDPDNIAIIGSDGFVFVPSDATLVQAIKPDERLYNPGQEWLRTTDMIKFTLYVDDDSRQWVRELNAGNGKDGVGITVLGLKTEAEIQALPAGNPGELWIASDTHTGWVYDSISNSWKSVGAIQGPAGVKGDRGDTGPIGLEGIQGDIGPTGHSGAGVPGPAGADGAIGIQGPKGDSLHLNVHQSVPKQSDLFNVLTVSFQKDQLVYAVDNGDLFVALKDMAVGYHPTGADWSNVGKIQGPPGHTPIVTADPLVVAIAAGGSPTVVDTATPIGDVSLKFGIPIGANGVKGLDGTNGTDATVDMNQGTY